MRPMNDEEKRWQRRSDARTLAEAEQIKADKERYKGAIVGAREIAQEEIARVQGIAKVAGMKAPQTPKTAEPTQCVYGHKVIQTEAVAVPFNKRGYQNPATLGRI